MIALGWSLVVATIALIGWQFLYFRSERRKTEKYPFYLLRDKVIWQLLTTEEKDTLDPIYRSINRTVDELHRYDFKFHTKVVASFIHDLVEEGYKCGFDPAKGWPRKRPPLHPLVSEFAKLLIKTAWQNSILIRFAMTKLGHKLLVTAAVPVVLAKFVHSHPDLVRRLKTSREYAVARQMVTAPVV